MDELEWWEFESQAEMAAQVAGDIGFVIESAVAAHGNARIAVPRGGSIEAVYKALLASKAIDWSKVTLVLTDDRLVKLDDPLSNYAKMQGLFGPKGAELVSLVDESALGDYREAGRLADERLKLIGWPLDLVLLDMGDDGHTASIMAGPDYDRAVAGPRERRAVGVRPDPLPEATPFDRVTLTAGALSSARAIMIAIVGDHQKAVLEQAIKEGPLSALPMGRVIAEIDSPIDIFWSAE